jgi:phenol 2-monooxygenase
VIETKVVYQQRHGEIDLGAVPALFLPQVGPFRLTDYEKVYAVGPDDDIFELRGIDRAGGCVVVVRPDQYVANVLPLTATAELADFFAQFLLPATVPAVVG